ncbi:MAG: PspC domain-containing protein [Bacteroidales bacterium]|nr:PspC domain-containing protein [Bacteroidales bacterium]
MKKVEKVSIGGYAFTLESEAAAALDSYIKEMELYYNNQEVLDGIEERMAELLLERTGSNGVVDKAMVGSVIDILGRPDRIAQDQPVSPAPDKPARKLYRDMENARIAGVCSGIGAYFKFDPVILRVAFALLFVASLFSFIELSGVLSFISPLAYIILWICIPPARTAQQRWAMRGDPGTAEGVRRNVENASGNVGDALRQVGQSPAWSGVGRVLEVIAGLLLLVISVAGLFGGALALFGWQWLGLGDMLNTAMINLMEEFPQSAVIVNTKWVELLAIAVYALPFIGMLYASIMMLFHMKSPSWHPGLVIFVVWLIAVVALTVLLLACVFSATAAVV